ncbi:MAD2L1-binding protein [Symphalangus syndactylus]|uniref:MAD2L1-binding protein n=1 Tax=Symphalangus syndactylus TaxID=9590 RepID=UPI002442A948|nr:MAD2L1-binding protein isoform X1 [Symphalangus syndactylus]XP_055119978.1 MAD2L1-binding protein isoform X1 [Symphalangus syndactylus]
MMPRETFILTARSSRREVVMAAPESEVLSPAAVPDLEWYEKSEETHASQIELLETGSTQEPLNPSESFCPRDCMVPVVFPGPVSQEGCCQFTCELLKHIMYQRQQLPLPYEQLKHFYRKPSPQAEEMLKKKSRATTEVSSRKCQQALAELESVLSHLEDFFARTLVPRVLILLGGNALSPKEFYELDLSLLAPYSVDQSLSTAACLRRLFRAIFMADAFSELQAPPLMGTIVMAQGHRDCGEDWFRPKLNYRVPSRGHKLTVTLSCGRPSIRTMAWEDYIWFQAPVTLKGFRE